MIKDNDLKIIQELRKNSQISVRDLAKKIGLTKSTVHDRIKKLESSGVIKGYTLKLDKAAIDEGFSAYVFLSTSHDLQLSKVKSELVKEIHHIDGEYDLLLKISCKDAQVFTTFLRTLKKDPAIRKLSTTTVMHTQRE